MWLGQQTWERFLYSVSVVKRFHCSTCVHTLHALDRTIQAKPTTISDAIFWGRLYSVFSSDYTNVLRHGCYSQQLVMLVHQPLTTPLYVSLQGVPRHLCNFCLKGTAAEEIREWLWPKNKVPWLALQKVSGYTTNHHSLSGKHPVGCIHLLFIPPLFGYIKVII